MSTNRVRLRTKCNKGAIPWLESVDSTMIIIHNDEYTEPATLPSYNDPQMPEDLYQEILEEAKKRNDSDLKFLELNRKLSHDKKSATGREFTQKWLQKNTPARTLYFNGTYVVVSLPYTNKAYYRGKEFLANAHALVKIGEEHHVFPVKWPDHKEDVDRLSK